jgi:hypothetical protein
MRAFVELGSLKFLVINDINTDAKVRAKFGPLAIIVRYYHSTNF